MQSDEVIAELRPRLSGALIALDFDGTLSPIVPDPEESRPSPGALDALTALTQRGARIGVVTGRDALTVLRLGGFGAVPDVFIEGLYGLEQWHAGQLHSPDTPAAMAALGRRLPDLLTTGRADERVWIEDKRLSLVLHTRPAADPTGEQERLYGPAHALAAELGVELHAGRNVLEFRLPGFDKGAALRRLIDATTPGAVLYAGDDVGDVAAFDAVAELRHAGMPAWSVAAVSDETPPTLLGAADVTVDGPAGVVAFLQALL